MQSKINPQLNSRELAGALKIYGSFNEVGKALKSIGSEQARPLSGLYHVGPDRKHVVSMAYHAGGTHGWSAIKLLDLAFDDNEGKTIEDICYFAPIVSAMVAEDRIYQTCHQVDEIAMEYVLILPVFDASGNGYANYYYYIGSDWTEWGDDGKFATPRLPPSLFKDWHQDSNESVIDPLSVLSLENKDDDKDKLERCLI